MLVLLQLMCLRESRRLRSWVYLNF